MLICQSTIALLDAIAESAFLLGIDGEILALNVAAARALGGQDPDDLLGRIVWDVLPPKVAASRRAIFEKVIETGEPAAFEDMREGRRISSSLCPVIVDGKVVRVAGFGNDSTLLAEQTSALRETERWLSESQRVARLGHFTYDIQTRIWKGSPSFNDVLGTDENHVEDISAWLEIVHPDDRDELRRYFADEVLTRRQQFDTEYRIVRPSDGAVRWIHGLGQVEFLEDGTAVEMLGIIQDITERKAEDEELRVYAELLETSPACVTMNTLDGRFLYANERCLRVHGYTRAEFLALQLNELDDADAAARIDERIGLIREQGEASFELQHVRKDGSLVPLAVTARLTSWRGQDVILSVAIDITQRRDAERELACHAERLASMVAERQRHIERLAASFASVVAIIGQVVETRDPYTAGHERRVAQLAVGIAEALELSSEDIEKIRTAALVHDVGKISIPAEILSKPGTLSALEFELIKGHPEAGYKILSSADMDYDITEVVYQHHERCDGSGYPRGLKGAELLAGAKVLMVADTVEAMVSHRPYRAGLGVQAALDEVEQGAGLRYDRTVVAACVSCFRERGFEFSDA